MTTQTIMTTQTTTHNTQSLNNPQSSTHSHIQNTQNQLQSNHPPNTSTGQLRQVQNPRSAWTKVGHTKKKNHLNIINWNLNGYNSRKIPLQQLIISMDLDILTLTEIKLRHPPRIKNFTPFGSAGKCDYGSPLFHGGAMIYVKDKIMSEEIPLVTPLQAAAVKLETPFPYNLCCIYFSPSEAITKAQIAT